MPTTYAHDLFGKRVYRKLSAKLQHLIRSNGNLYRIGQHGPDILFYYFISKNPVTQYGVQMHGRKAVLPCTFPTALTRCICSTAATVKQRSRNCIWHNRRECI